MPTEHTQPTQKPFDRRVLVAAAFLLVVVGGGIAGAAYFAVAQKTVYIEKAHVSAPTVDLGPTVPGVLRSVFVSPNEVVPPNTVVAQVGNELIKSIDGGLVISTNDNLGKIVNPGETVVEMIDPAQLRVVGEVEEDKGLTSIKPGQPAAFTVDAFGGKTFVGTVDEVSPTAESGDVVFSISDKREQQSFDVKVRFDTIADSQLRNGMSAKIWVYKN